MQSRTWDWGLSWVLQGIVLRGLHVVHCIAMYRIVLHCIAMYCIVLQDRMLDRSVYSRLTHAFPTLCTCTPYFCSFSQAQKLFFLVFHLNVEVFDSSQNLAYVAMTWHDKILFKHSSVSFSHKCESNSVSNFLQKLDQDIFQTQFENLSIFDT